VNFNEALKNVNDFKLKNVKKSEKMKKYFFLVILLFPLFSGTAFVNAQVRIGANAVPEKGTVLDLKSSAAAPGYVGGLLLPHVSLTNLNAVPASWAGSGTIDPSKLTGLLVFNSDDSVNPKGIYVWNGTKWLYFVMV